MRILIAHSFYRSPGGEDTYVAEQAEFLASAGHDVRVLRKENAELQGGARVASRMAYSGELIDEVRSLLREFVPDIIHLHNPYPSFGPAVHLAAARESVPLVFTVHNMRLRCPNGLMFTEGAVCHRCEGGLYYNAVLHDCFPTRSQRVAYATNLWGHRFVLKLENKISLFVAPSRFVADRLVAWGIPENRIAQVRNLTHVPSEPPPIQSDAHGLFLGRLSSEKGVEVLLHALRSAGDPPFAIAGDGPLRGTLEASAEELGLRNTRFFGRLDVEGVRRLIEQSSFVVIPSMSEEIAPFSAAEALAHGRPIIVSRIGGLTELAVEGRGLLCDPGDASAFAEAIGRLTASAELCREMGLKAHRFASEELTRQNHVRRLESLYATLI